MGQFLPVYVSEEEYMTKRDETNQVLSTKQNILDVNSVNEIANVFAIPLAPITTVTKNTRQMALI